MSVEKKKEKEDAGSSKKAGTQQYTVPKTNPFDDDPAFAKNKPSTDVDRSTGTVKTQDSNFDVDSGNQASTAKGQDPTPSKKKDPELWQGPPKTTEKKEKKEDQDPGPHSENAGADEIDKRGKEQTTEETPEDAL